MDDYRTEDDVLMAHKLTNKFAGQEIQITVDKVEFNADIAKDRFDLPDEIKALLEESGAGCSRNPRLLQLRRRTAAS